ncbi:uncharacterized protein MYCFIDRAFT_197343 [Pseudocercospora fijiensis CIRAD86]|uniref:Uncharacterized protein n=1 Tax=Pseudocercospora fijiensis (strain CIRAD86) TaxID=383855 RepID=M3AY97_PSEFD|nr:uncharacterized protein MYCFIDRAFT_197343 [Pseudocercospora fijiensis CIRAD86]EME82138.1 hypothetical protein MYCFIDRAFT_197343 [Pseudocercospora fijiensis CIRAD86]
MGLLGLAKDKLTRERNARQESPAKSSAAKTESMLKAERCLKSSTSPAEVHTASEKQHESDSDRRVECLAVTQDAGHTTLPSPTPDSPVSKPKIVMSGLPASAGYFHSSHMSEDRYAWPHPATRSYDDRTAA